MNHSCEPNCRLFTVSYNHADTNLYELAFFALREIKTGEELTFDYLDPEDDDENNGLRNDQKGKKAASDQWLITDEMAKKHEREKGYKPTKCRCGSKRCRGYFFFSHQSGSESNPSSSPLRPRVHAHPVPLPSSTSTSTSTPTPSSSLSTLHTPHGKTPLSGAVVPGNGATEKGLR